MVTTERVLEMYRGMVTSVVCEQKLFRLVDDGVAKVSYHPGRGQEAVGVGACAVLRQDDYIMYTHRGITHLVGKGLPLEKLFGDFVATTAGTTRGLGAGLPHLADPERGILGFSGLLGGGFGIAAGAALSVKYRESGQVCVCFFGEGTANRGPFHEAANASSVWKLPVVWLCENNEWGMSTHVSKSTSVANIADRAAAYGMPGIIVDGQDVVAVFRAVREAVERARRGDGPTLVEAKTLRFQGHYYGDPQSYRSKDEVARAKERDPVDIAAARLRELGVSDAELEAVWAQVQELVEEAAAAALAAPKPTRERVFEGLYA
jgi:pyruvate dehydrogenase E1 component alpha subunit